jgi:Cd2+/Zn2+-exporting ATPase/Cu+-exporting ATPase
VKLNIGFTAAYNLLGLGLAALGLLPLVLAAVAQSLPDLGILANSARLLRQPERTASCAARGDTGPVPP